MKFRSKSLQVIVYFFVIILLFALCTAPGGKKGTRDEGGIPPDIDPKDTTRIMQKSGSSDTDSKDSTQIQEKSIPPDIDPIDTTKIKKK